MTHTEATGALFFGFNIAWLAMNTLIFLQVWSNYREANVNLMESRKLLADTRALKATAP